jgi:poly-gamma-glutamate capsule biosynthesis protein CapA/YwtB (metallophosphatase superfamily)
MRAAIAKAMKLVGWLSAIVLLTGCARFTGPGTPPPPTAVFDPPPATEAVVLIPRPPEIGTPLTSPTSPPPTPLPSPTPLPEITLYVPESWRGPAGDIVARLNETAVQHVWQLVDDPQADVRLAQDIAGAQVQEVPLALAVPFTTPWESVTLAEAQQILASGHEAVTVMPWPDLPAGSKALQVESLRPADAAYPFKQSWVLAADPAYAEAVAELQPLLQEAAPGGAVHLTAVGDLMLDRSLGYNLERGELAYPFSEVADRLQIADMTVGNMESALGDIGEAQPKRYPFRAPPEAAQALSLAGFDVVSLANNHGMDYGPESLLQGIELLRTQGILPVGAGAHAAAAHAPAIVETKGMQIAFFGYVNVPQEAIGGFDTASWTATDSSPGIAWADPPVISADIASIRDQVDLVIVLLHSGFEYQQTPSEPQQAAARAAVDAGADLVVGHHAHILQGVEWYRDGVILYGTGNFAFDIDGPPETAVFHVWFDADGVREVAIEPAIVQFGGQPRLATSWEAPAILSQVYYLTDVLNPR